MHELDLDYRTTDFRIGDCVVRPSLNRIEFDGDDPEKIAPRAMDTLVCLALHAGKVVSGDQLMDFVWRDRVVSDGQIYNVMSHLRRAFKDHDGDERIIQTIPKRGYRLVATVEPIRSREKRAVSERSATYRAIQALAAGCILSAAILVVVSGDSDPISGTGNGSTSLEPAVVPGPLAVLPFDSLSPAADDSYFAAGIHSEILSQIGQLTDLTVVPSSSILRGSDANRSVSEVAATLNAGAVLLGSVFYADNRVRVYTQLIDAATELQIWSASYERNLVDVFAIQTDIATRVATALEAHLNVNVSRTHEQRLTDSPEAYAFYLRAGESSVTRGLPSAVRHLYLDEAIARDPEFGQAHARKADVYAAGLVENFSSGVPNVSDVDEIYNQIRSSVETALAIDPSLESAYLALGRLYQYRWRWAEAKQAFERAAELAPDNPDVLRAFAHFASHTGLYKRAVSLATRTTELLPTHAGAQFRLGTTNLYAADLDAAIAAFRNAVELDPSHTLAHTYLAIAQGITGYVDEADMELQVAERTLRDNPLPHIIALIAYGYSRIGFSEDAARLIDEIGTTTGDLPTGHGTCALIALAKGSVEHTLSCLRSAADAIDNQVPDSSHHNLMLVIANVFSDPTLYGPAPQAMLEYMRTTLAQSDSAERADGIPAMP
jgi:DNA-binding winged helix-turn-helix (wHTH) protein/TolB-like protein/tetratricopeptide (TPR) repeat protein